MAKLTITRCNVSGGSISPTGDSFESAINPADLKQSMSIAYIDQRPGEPKPVGISAATPKFGYVNAEKLNFTLVMDGTGVVEYAADEEVIDQIDALRDIVYSYNGTNHETNVVKITWGSGMEPFYGRMESMSLDYTLFRANGEPLRAKATLAFASFVTQQEEALTAERSSPDLTHRVTVQAGDTLPLLCKRIYDDASQYLFVARENRLSSFRRLTPGQVLNFPPLR